MLRSPNHPHRRWRIMAAQQNPKKIWIKPVIRRLEGEEAERARAFIMESNGLFQEPFKFRKAKLTASRT